MITPHIKRRSLVVSPDEMRGFHPVLARVYATRVADARDLDLTWEALPSPASLADLPKAAERLALSTSMISDGFSARGGHVS